MTASAIDALCRRAEAVAGELTVDRDALARLVGARPAWADALSRGEAPDVTDAGLRELLLACSMRAGDLRAVPLFERLCIAPIEGVLSRAKLSPDEADELRQKVRERLLIPDDAGATRLEGYAGEGRLEGLVRVMASRLVVDLARSRRARPGSDDALLDLPAGTHDPALLALKQRCQGDFRTAFASAVASLDARERNLLRMHLLGGVTLEQLAAMYGVHRATVVRWIAAARERVLSATRRDLESRGVLRGDELGAFIAMVESGLDLSVERLFRSQRED